VPKDEGVNSQAAAGEDDLDPWLSVDVESWSADEDEEPLGVQGEILGQGCGPRAVVVQVRPHIGRRIRER